jgi:hypothetical protein
MTKRQREKLERILAKCRQTAADRVRESASLTGSFQGGPLPDTFLCCVWTRS